MKKIFAIIGNPISHSLSPILHNYWFKKYSINAEYTLLDVKENELENITKKIRAKELDGINITLPYKQKIIPFVDQLINDAKITNSINTIYLGQNNTLIGENTDVFGLQAAYLKEITQTENKKALVIGAGGVSPSVIFSLYKMKIKNISLVNRTYDKSIFLKKKFKFLNILDWKFLKQEIKNFDIIINATSLGLKTTDKLPFDITRSSTNAVIADIIMQPEETELLKHAKSLGRSIHYGKYMIESQIDLVGRFLKLW
mgnify:CR=1 FL=1